MACKVGERAFFLYGYAKNDLDNVGDAALSDLRRTAKDLYALSEDELEILKTQEVL